MFGLFRKNPIKKLEKEYKEKMAEAMKVQRSGNLRLYAQMMEEVELIQARIQELKSR